MHDGLRFVARCLGKLVLNINAWETWRRFCYLIVPCYLCEMSSVPRCPLGRLVASRRTAEHQLPATTIKAPTESHDIEHFANLLSAWRVLMDCRFSSGAVELDDMPSS